MEDEKRRARREEEERASEQMGLVRITSLSPVSMDLRTRRPAEWHAKN